MGRRIRRRSLIAYSMQRVVTTCILQVSLPSTVPINRGGKREHFLLRSHMIWFVLFIGPLDGNNLHIAGLIAILCMC